MSNIKFCRFDSNCGPQSTCRGNLYGLIRAKCISTKGSCRLDHNCPKYYQCVGNSGGLKTGKCLLAISRSNPMSKSLGNISTSLLDPAGEYRKTHSINWVLTILIVLVLGGIGYYVYDAFLKPIGPAIPGYCRNSADCRVKGPFGVDFEFQCGRKIYSYPTPTSPPQLIGVKPHVCDCSVGQSGGYSSHDTMYKSGSYWHGTPNPNWLFETAGTNLDTTTNCQQFYNEKGYLQRPLLNTTLPPAYEK